MKLKYTDFWFSSMIYTAFLMKCSAAALVTLAGWYVTFIYNCLVFSLQFESPAWADLQECSLEVESKRFSSQELRAYTKMCILIEV